MLKNQYVSTQPSKKNAPKILPIGADFQAAVTTNRRLFGTNITPKTRLMHAAKVQFSAPDRRRIGANFKVATEFRCLFGANLVPVFRRA